MCKLFKVSRSCYYNWIEKGCVVNRVDVEFNNLIKNVFEQSRATYGTRRLKEILKQRYGLIVSRRKIQKSLKQLNLKVKMKRRFKVITTTSNHTLPIAPNYVNRDFYSSSTDKVYVGDRSVKEKILNISFFNTRIHSNQRKMVISCSCNCPRTCGIT